ncbi:hypothetical protein XENTR_v10020587 [Xenopus tropicalis]|nr:hypothetical protein XENTR_v10020587 [Xenopus tropicalis]
MGAKLSNILHQQRHTETDTINQCFDVSEPWARPCLLDTRHQLVRDIQKEMRIAAGAQKMYRASKGKKAKAQVKELRNSSEKRVKALYSSLLKLNEEIARREAERTQDAVPETTETTINTSVAYPAEKDTGPEVLVILDPTRDSSQHHPDASSKEPGPEKEQPQVPPDDSEVPAEEIVGAEEDKRDVPAQEEVVQGEAESLFAEPEQQPENEEESDVQVHGEDSSETSQGPHPGDYCPTQDCQAEEPSEETQSTQELQFSSFSARDFRRIKVLGRGSYGKVINSVSN